MLTCEAYNRRLRDLTAFGVLVTVTALASALLTPIQKHATAHGTPPVYRASKVGQVRTLSLQTNETVAPVKVAQAGCNTSVL